MGMDPIYQPLYNQVRNLEFQVKDALDDPSASAAQSLRNELQHLEDEMEMHKSPRNLEDRIRNIQELLAQARSHEGGYMSVDDAAEFYRTFEDIRRDVRKFPNY